MYVHSTDSKRNTHALFVGAVFFALSFFFAQTASAADFSISPASKSVSVGESFTLTVYAASPDQPANAFEGSILFDPSVLEITSLQKSTAVISLWVQEPSFSNSGGSATFSGVALNPGFSGSRGAILTLRMKAKRAGSTDVRFTGTSILANDGNGTNIATGAYGSAISVAGSTPTPEPEPQRDAADEPEVVSAPAANDTAPHITSTTHPDGDGWYKADVGVFLIENPEGATATRMLLSRSQNGTPSVLYEPAITKKEISGLPSGVSYLLVQAKTAAGWGPIATKRIQVDSEVPSLEASVRTREDLTDPRITLDAKASDKLSGIGSLSFSVDGGVRQPLVKNTGGEYVVALQNPGSHTIEVVALDRAGNEARRSLSVEVAALEAPRLTYIPGEVPYSEMIRISGTSKYAGAIARISFSKNVTDVTSTAENKSVSYAEARIAADGTFTVERTHDLPVGQYYISASVIDDRGARSTPSDVHTIHLAHMTLSAIANEALAYLRSVLGLLLAFFGFAVLAFFFYEKVFLYRKALGRELRELDLVTHQTLLRLRSDVDRYVRDLEKAQGKRKLSAIEAKFLRQMKRDIADAESAIDKEIRDVARAAKKR